MRLAVHFAWAVALLVVVLRFVGGSPPEKGLEGLVAAVALGSVVGAPAAAARLSYATAPAIVVGAGLGTLPTAALSVVTLPVAVSALVLLAVGAGEWRRRGGGGWPAVGTALLVPAAVVLAVVLLFAHQDPRAWTTGGESGTISDVITYAESAAILGVLAAMLGVTRQVAAAAGRPS